MYRKSKHLGYCNEIKLLLNHLLKTFMNYCLKFCNNSNISLLLLFFLLLVFIFVVKMSDNENFSKLKNWLPAVSTLFLSQNNFPHKKLTQLIPKGWKTLTIRMFYNYFIISIMFYTRSVLMKFQARWGFFNRRGFKERGVGWECHRTRDRWLAKFKSFTVVSELFFLIDNDLWCN